LKFGWLQAASPRPYYWWFFDSLEAFIRHGGNERVDIARNLDASYTAHQSFHFHIPRLLYFCTQEHFILFYSLLGGALYLHLDLRKFNGDFSHGFAFENEACRSSNGSNGSSAPS
jgi:hypothetical protein